MNSDTDVMPSDTVGQLAWWIDRGEKLRVENERLRGALDELNRLRSNVVATQSASWSNSMYPMVAILERAGFELIDDVTPEDMADHLLCYGGAGGSPEHRLPACRTGDLWRRRYDEAKEHGTARQRLHRGSGEERTDDD